MLRNVLLPKKHRSPHSQSLVMLWCIFKSQARAQEPMEMLSAPLVALSELNQDVILAPLQGPAAKLLLTELVMGYTLRNSFSFMVQKLSFSD